MHQQWHPGQLGSYLLVSQSRLQMGMSAARTAQLNSNPTLNAGAGLCMHQVHCTLQAGKGMYEEEPLLWRWLVHQ